MKQAATPTQGGIKLSGVIATFADLVDSNMRKIIKEHGQGTTILGYDMIAFSSKKNIILQNINLLNEMLTLYTKYLVDKPINLDTLAEILALPITSEQLLVEELKRKFLEWNKIEIPNFPNVKMSKLIELFEFSDDAEVLIKSFVAMANKVETSESIQALRLYNKYFDTSLHTLKLNDALEAQLLQSCTRYVGEREMTDILSAHLLCVALNKLKRNDYDFNEMPEIDFRIMSMISVDSIGAFIKLDMDAICGEGISEMSPDVEFEYLGESKESGLPMFRLGSIEYEYVAPAFLSPFGEQMHTGSGPDKRRVEIMDYTSPARREQFIRYSIKLAKIGSGTIARRKGPNGTR